MSNYTLAVSWSGKDALSDSDAAKVISGADFNTEFTTVQTAINSKSNLNGDSGEAFSTSTAGSSSNTTIAASTQYVTSAISTATTGHDTKANTLLAVYPVGCVYTSISNTNPSSLFGGTWTSFGAGKVLVGLDSGDGDFDAAEETGGAKTHTLSIAEMPSHSHSEEGTTAASETTGWYGGGQTGAIESGATTGTAGSGSAHNNLQPYIVVYFFKRTL